MQHQPIGLKNVSRSHRRGQDAATRATLAGSAGAAHAGLDCQLATPIGQRAGRREGTIWVHESPGHPKIKIRHVTTCPTGLRTASAAIAGGDRSPGEFSGSRILNRSVQIELRIVTAHPDHSATRATRGSTTSTIAGCNHQGRLASLQIRTVRIVIRNPHQCQAANRPSRAAGPSRASAAFASSQYRRNRVDFSE